MSRTTSITCDNCHERVTQEAVVQYVELTVGGNGAARTTYGTDDLCRSCYAAMLRAIEQYIGRK